MSLRICILYCIMMFRRALGFLISFIFSAETLNVALEYKHNNDVMIIKQMFGYVNELLISKDDKIDLEAQKNLIRQVEELKKQNPNLKNPLPKRWLK